MKYICNSVSMLLKTYNINEDLNVMLICVVVFFYYARGYRIIKLPFDIELDNYMIVVVFFTQLIYIAR